MSGRLVIIGGSAGSLEVMLQVLSTIEPGLPHPVVLVLHRKASEDQMLESLFSAKCLLRVIPVEDKTPLSPGNIYIAPSDYHLLFESDGTLSLDTSAKVNFSRPSIDVSFESAADAWRGNLTAILLSGANSDGSAGLEAIKSLGGTVIIQDPETANMPIMPQSAITRVDPDLVAGIKQLAEIIRKGTL